MSTDNELAKLHFRVGAEHYARGEYDKAIVEFQAAYEVVPLPALHYDLARCHERLGHKRDAIAEYRLFADAAPDAESRATVEAKLVELRGPGPQAHPLGGHLPVALPALVGALGVGVLAAGLGLYYTAGGHYDDCVAALPTPAPCSNARLDTTQTLERGGIGLFVTGGVLLAADVGLWVVWARGRHLR